MPVLVEAEKVFHQLEKLLEQSSQMDNFFRAYLRALAKSFKVKRVSLMLLDEARHELFIRESEGLFPELKTKTRVRLGEGISGRVAERGEAVLVPDVEKDKRLLRERRGKFRSGGFICIPLKVRGKIYGVLNVSEKKGNKPFELEDLKKLEVFGMQLAVLVENQHLRRKIEQLQKKPIREIAEVSHDFRIPLTCVEEVLNLMEKEDLGPITGSQRQFLQLAKRNVGRMITTFDHLIEIATRFRKSPLRSEKLELAGLLEELRQTFEPKARKKEAGLKLELPKEAVWVQTDRAKIQEVLMNLIDNAVKHTRQGSEVKLRLKASENFARFEIEDQGPGIDGKRGPTLFDKVLRVKKNRGEKDPESHGLGLAICHDIVQMIGGKIGYDSKPGVGATFFIEIPKKWSAPSAGKRSSE